VAEKPGIYSCGKRDDSDTTGMVDQVTSGLKDATGIDLTELLSSFHQPFQPREDNE
jgi:flotillin